MAHHIHLVASDQPRNGKSLLARLIADALIADHAHLQLMDCDGLHGMIAHHFSDCALIIDPSRVDGQIALFDHMLAHPHYSYVIDLPARHLDVCLGILASSGFLAEARSLGLNFTCWFIVDRSAANFRKARTVWHAVEGQFIPVRNEHVGSYADTPEIARSYLELAELGTLSIPALSDFAQRWLEDRRNSLQQLIRPRIEGALKLRPPSELHVFFRRMVEQIDAIGRL